MIDISTISIRYSVKTAQYIDFEPKGENNRRFREFMSMVILFSLYRRNFSVEFTTNFIKRNLAMNNSDYNQSFTAMVGRHEKIIFSVCFFYATSEMPFDDIRQEVLISLYKGYRNFRQESSESTWVYKVCINTCLFSLKSFTPKIKTISFDELPAVHFQDDNNEWREKLEWLYSVIAQLKPMDKALILMWLDELSYDEIASNMGIPRNTVASRLYRIKEKISSRKEV